MTTFSASVTKCTVLLPQPHDCSCYVSRPILAAPPFSLQKNTELRPHEFAYSSDWWHQPRLGNLTLAWSRRICGISPALLNTTVWIPVSINFFWFKYNQFLMTHSDTRLSTGPVLNIFLMEKWKKCTAFVLWETDNGSRIYLWSKKHVLKKIHSKLQAKWNIETKWSLLAENKLAIEICSARRVKIP
jgi:predicted transposase YbfD/YdcC